MEITQIMPAVTNTQSFGRLRVSIHAELTYTPVAGATVNISYPGQTNAIEQLTTDASGQTGTIELTTPPVEYSLEPESTQPYSEYTLTISAPGYETAVINNTQLLAGETAVQPVQLVPLETAPSDIVIPAHTLYGEYPPKIPEDEIKPVSESGEIVLSRVVIPETVVVHTGPPTDTGAKNYYVPYKDYIKNVASSEIYATWPESTIVANVLAIMSFTLNRVYTEWYRNKGFNFTITNSTAYDHFFVPGRNVYESISEVVDTIFTNFLSRPNVRQPILTQYCDGSRVTCPQWMSQWGSKTLGEQGYEPIEILRYYYGDDMYINTAEQISGIPSSWPGSNLTIGSRGQKVMQMQEQLNRIARNYPALPTIAVDGIYGPATANAVKEFQKIFGLPQTGIVDYRTWYKISEIYVGVSRIAELI
ncbi:MAG: peptidoglycan-binding protein [Catenibacillus sp.]|nr:peptidoglycan-binding protein [Catenibacillus sp.]